MLLPIQTSYWQIIRSQRVLQKNVLDIEKENIKAAKKKVKVDKERRNAESTAGDL